MQLFLLFYLLWFLKVNWNCLLPVIKEIRSNFCLALSKSWQNLCEITLLLNRTFRKVLEPLEILLCANIFLIKRFIHHTRIKAFFFWHMHISIHLPVFFWEWRMGIGDYCLFWWRSMCLLFVLTDRGGQGGNQGGRGGFRGRRGQNFQRYWWQHSTFSTQKTNVKFTLFGVGGVTHHWMRSVLWMWHSDKHIDPIFLEKMFSCVIFKS